MTLGAQLTAEDFKMGDSNFAQAILGGVQAGQQLRAGALEEYATRNKLQQQGQLQQLQQKYLGATDDKEKQGLLQQMAVYNPEHAKGIASIGMLGVNPFEGNSMEAQAANIQYQRRLAAGEDPSSAKLNAINDVRTTNVTYNALGLAMSGKPLPQVGQPALGGAPTNRTVQAAPLPPYGNSAPVTPAEQAAGRLPVQDFIGDATPEELSFVKEVMSAPNPARAYNTKVKEHPELAAAHPSWNNTIAGHFRELQGAMGENIPTGEAVLPPTQKTVTPEEMTSPFAQKARVEQEVGKEELQSPTRGKLEEKLLNSTEALARVKDIDKGFKPEYLQFKSRAGNKISSLKDFAGMKLSPEETAQLSDYTGFARASIDNMNRLLNELSGAAVSPAEGERIKASQPNAGTGLFDGDSPVVFKRKMDDVKAQMRNATLRYNYALSNGMNPLKIGIALEDIPNLIEKRGAGIEKEIRQNNPGMSQDAIDMQTKLQLGKEFGM